MVCTYDDSRLPIGFIVGLVCPVPGELLQCAGIGVVCPVFLLIIVVC